MPKASESSGLVESPRVGRVDAQSQGSVWDDPIEIGTSVE